MRVLGLVLIILAIVFFTASNWVAGIVCLVLGLLAFRIWNLRGVRAKIRKHIQALSIERQKKLRIDPYGNVRDENWRKEVTYFYQRVLYPFPAFGTIKLRLESAYRLINREVDRHLAKQNTSAMDVEALSPTAYESYCTQRLNEYGWHAATTKASGDQGIDIVATRNGRKAVFQCKKKSSPVGNDAVQQVVAGKEYESADYAFVVSNADFTRAARELANKCGVHLIHHSSLSDLSPFLKE
jgi:restriction system protein